MQKYFYGFFFKKLKLGLVEKEKNWTHDTTEEQMKKDIQDLYDSDENWKELSIYQKLMIVEPVFLREGPYMKCGVNFTIPGLPEGSMHGFHRGCQFAKPGFSL